MEDIGIIIGIQREGKEKSTSKIVFDDATEMEALYLKIDELMVSFCGNGIGSFSDDYHTFNELYDFRKAYNAILFNEWSAQGKYGVHKSLKHSDGELCFGGGWFVVSAETPAGQITNHYKEEDWNLFKCDERETAEEWDGHTAGDALQRLLKLAGGSNE